MGGDLALDVSEGDVRLKVVVRVLDAPGPSGYQVRRYRGESTIPRLPEIDAVALQSRATLEDFLRALMVDGGGRTEVSCLEPRIPKLLKLVRVQPGDGGLGIEVKRADGGGQGG
jgi:hypothetical protein